jgi:hypothetical protein
VVRRRGPYRHSCEANAFQKRGLMTRAEFGVAYELQVFHMYSALKTFFKQVRNHALAKEHFVDRMFKLYRRQLHVSQTMHVSTRALPDLAIEKPAKMRTLCFGENYKIAQT